ncbi:hypothetical protein MSP8887_01501 [Marinomonas spartinae]|uniref:DUF4810 domain-containing protein n=1 Tax=Marinomonas spartinae TaxID=1792290 RepID=UPI000808BF87|nr:DUF4810 domain-containing protein [Marinomonas spartinae]SBS31332.1 hypothetical protein MSP8887_01501 [Marinomonas spartinae]
MKKIYTILATTVLTLSLVGCASTKKSTFYWGSYEGLIYDMYVEPGSADPTTQIDKLTATIQEAEANGKPVAPGIHAHLGYMYALQGNLAQSRAEFLTEKTMYPESDTLIDGMMNRLKGAQKQ